MPAYLPKSNRWSSQLPQKSLCEISKLARLCRARLQAGTLKSSRCPPEGGRYTNQNRVLTQPLQPVGFRLLVLSRKQQAEACPTRIGECALIQTETHSCETPGRHGSPARGAMWAATSIRSPPGKY